MSFDLTSSEIASMPPCTCQQDNMFTDVHYGHCALKHWYAARETLKTIGMLHSALAAEQRRHCDTDYQLRQLRKAGEPDKIRAGLFEQAVREIMHIAETDGSPMRMAEVARKAFSAVYPSTPKT